jgi:hypothetical protein
MGAAPFSPSLGVSVAAKLFVMWQQNTVCAVVWDFLRTRPALVQLGQLPHQEVGSAGGDNMRLSYFFVSTTVKP